MPWLRVSLYPLMLTIDVSDLCFSEDGADTLLLIPPTVAATAKSLQSCLTVHPRPWYSPGKNPGVGCHFLLQCIKVKSESEVAQSCLTLCDPMDCSLPGSSVHGIFQARYWSGMPLPSLIPSIRHS